MGSFQWHKLRAIAVHLQLRFNLAWRTYAVVWSGIKSKEFVKCTHLGRFGLRGEAIAEGPPSLPPPATSQEGHDVLSLIDILGDWGERGLVRCMKLVTSVFVDITKHVHTVAEHSTVQCLIKCFKSSR